MDEVPGPGRERAPLTAARFWSLRTVLGGIPNPKRAYVSPRLQEIAQRMEEIALEQEALDLELRKLAEASTETADDPLIGEEASGDIPVPQIGMPRLGMWSSSLPWSFSLPRETCSRDEAWSRCVKSGLRVGIPEHAWLRDHSWTCWGYRTADDAMIARREAAMIARREAHLPPAQAVR